jgi:hypothetical protein
MLEQACRDLCLHIQMSGQILHFLETVILHLLRQSSTVLYKKSARPIYTKDRKTSYTGNIDIDIQNYVLYIVIDIFGGILRICEY